jgi:hypothetical protein
VGDQQSLIEAEARQGLLAVDLPAAVYASGERDRRYTGRRLFAERPEVYRAIVVRLAAGDGILRIAGDLDVHPATVIGVRDREGVAVAIEKRGLAGLTRVAARMATEAVADAVWDVVEGRRESEERFTPREMRELAITAGILLQRSHEMGDGGEEVSIGGGGSGPGRVEALSAWLADEERRMRLGAGNGEAKGGRVIEGEVVGPAAGVDGEGI